MQKRTKRYAKYTRHKAVPAEQVALSSTLSSEIRSDLASLLTEMAGCPSSGRSDRFKAEYLASECWSKYLDPELSNGAEERKTAAIKKWQAAELRNASTNVRLYFDETRFDFPKGRKVSSHRIIERAGATIKRVLGESPDMEVLYGTFTGGASTKYTRGPGVASHKFMGEAHVTAACLPWFEQIFQTCEVWQHYRANFNAPGETLPASIKVVPGSVLFTVPKTTEIDRVAAKEPGLNMFCQKGIGDFIRRRLKSTLGVDLNDQSKNQRLAKHGARSRELATIDLSSASDLISHQLVFALLPLDWFHLLNDVRSQVIEVEGEIHDLNMFSSMGNAFTFELESLIFWALTNAIAYFAGVRGTISVFGDDIICPRQIAGLLARVFSFLGFKVNAKKSFWRGPFRESCGKHYHDQVDVTPFYIKEPIGDLSRLIHFLNRLRQWAETESLGICDPRVLPLWQKYQKLIPDELKGGRDCDLIQTLVSPSGGRKRLVSVAKQHKAYELGSYLRWLREADQRDPRCAQIARTEHPFFWERPIDAEGHLVVSNDDDGIKRWWEIQDPKKDPASQGTTDYPRFPEETKASKVATQAT